MDSTGTEPVSLTIGAVAAAAEKLLLIVAIATIIIVVANPTVRDTVIDGIEAAATTVATWVEDQKKGIEEKLTASIAKANPQKSDKYHVHHIVAQSDRRAAPARYILSLVGLNVNSIVNLVLVKDTVHQRLHTTWYFNTVNYLIMGAYSAAGLDKAMQFKNVTNALISLQVYITSLNAFAP